MSVFVLAASTYSTLNSFYSSQCLGLVRTSRSRRKVERRSCKYEDVRSSATLAGASRWTGQEFYKQKTVRKTSLDLLAVRRNLPPDFLYYSTQCIRLNRVIPSWRSTSACSSQQKTVRRRRLPSIYFLLVFTHPQSIRSILHRALASSESEPAARVGDSDDGIVSTKMPARQLQPPVPLGGQADALNNKKRYVEDHRSSSCCGYHALTPEFILFRIVRPPPRRDKALVSRSL